METYYVFRGEYNMGICVIRLSVLCLSFDDRKGTRSDGSYDLPRDGAAQLAGVALFLLWFLVVWMYFRLIRRNTVQISMIEENPTTGRQRVRHKWFDTLLQIVMIVTGTLLRWSYVVVFVFNR